MRTVIEGNGRRVVGFLAVTCLVIVAAWWPRSPEVRTPIRPPVLKAAPATPALPFVAAPPSGRAEPAPYLAPASNAFTTLTDYRRRQAAKPQAPEPSKPSPAGRNPETELGQVRFAVRDFRAAFGSNPVGSNREITRALLGDNARGAKLLDASTARLNARGELLDAWGHPYFFHALSGTLMEIHSAGPDGRIFTDDDLVQ